MSLFRWIWPLAAAVAAPAAGAAGSFDAALQFDPTRYATVHLTVDGVATAVRQYKIVYVARPIRMARHQYNEQTRSTTTLDEPTTYQTLVFSVPEALIGDTRAPLWLRVNNSGWFASAATGPGASLRIKEGAALSTTGPDSTAAAAATALQSGFIVVDVGSRSRGIRAEDGRWVGKAPAAVVDVKAAIRYLRLNDRSMPGSAERIVLTGHSGGGALTAAVAASGNNAEYLPELAEIGAAGVTGTSAKLTSHLRDDVLMAVAYSPIHNLGNIDKGYEWQYGAIRDDSNTPALNSIPYSAGKQPAAAAELAAAFGPYVNSLGLRLADGSPLTIDRLQALITTELREEVERQIAQGTAVPQLGETFTVVKLPTNSSEAVVNDWLALRGTGRSATVANIDTLKFLRFQATNLTINPPTTPRRLKPVPSFDSVGVTDLAPWALSGESTLFGNENRAYANFTEWSWNNNAVKGDGSGLDDTGQAWREHVATQPLLARQLRLVNPLDLLRAADSQPAPYWYLRHGMLDRDTALAMQLLLKHALMNDTRVKALSFKLPYLLGHTGYADLPESFDWIKARLAAHP